MKLALLLLVLRGLATCGQPAQPRQRGAVLGWQSGSGGGLVLIQAGSRRLVCEFTKGRTTLETLGSHQWSIGRRAEFAVRGGAGECSLGLLKMLDRYDRRMRGAAVAVVNFVEALRKGDGCVYFGTTDQLPGG